MREVGDYVEVAMAPTSFLAQLWVGRLRASGLDARADSGQMMDEFTMAQGMQGAGVVSVYVHKDDAPTALLILEAMQSGEGAPDDEDLPDESEEE